MRRGRKKTEYIMVIDVRYSTHSRLLLLNIKLAISNMFRYAMRRKVSLPGDEQENIDISSTSIPGKIQSRLLL